MRGPAIQKGLTPESKRLFLPVIRLGLAMPGVEAATRYDGSPVLKLQGCFLAGLAMHRSAEQGTLVVRANAGDRELLTEDAPETYYLTDYYRPYPLILVRLRLVDDDALRDLLKSSWTLTLLKSGKKQIS